MKLSPLLGIAIVLLTPTVALAQASRLDTQIDQRLGGKLNQGENPPVRGTVGPDPYVGPGSVSPFARAPVVPLISAPVRDAADPYFGRAPSLQPSLKGATVTEPQSIERDLSGRPSSDEASSRERSQQRPGSEPESSDKVGRRLDDGEPEARNGRSPASDQPPRASQLIKQQPCVNGRTRTANGDCTGPLRPRPR
jgi:hypothetical protein